jgi:hypothetical protein
MMNHDDVGVWMKKRGDLGREKKFCGMAKAFACASREQAIRFN